MRSIFHDVFNDWLGIVKELPSIIFNRRYKIFYFLSALFFFLACTLETGFTLNLFWQVPTLLAFTFVGIPIFVLVIILPPIILFIRIIEPELFSREKEIK